MTKKRLKTLHYSNEVVDDVSRLVELHLRFHGYGSGEWTDSAVRRYVRDAGDLLPRLHKLTRADSTTRNLRRARALQRAYDGLEHRIAELAEAEELAAIRPALDGNQIMQILDVPPGPVVGQAYQYPAGRAARPRADGHRRSSRTATSVVDRARELTMTARCGSSTSTRARLPGRQRRVGRTRAP